MRRSQAGTPVRKYGVDYALSAAWIGATPYWLAAKFAEPEIMRLLADAKADTRRAMPDGTTPLMATLMGSVGQGDRRERFQTEVQMAVAAPLDAEATVTAATLAIELGADLNATTGTGDTALHLAATRALNPGHQASGGRRRRARHQEQTRADAARGGRRPPRSRRFRRRHGRRRCRPDESDRGVAPRPWGQRVIVSFARRGGPL